MSLPLLSSSAAANGGGSGNDKVYVCKYVGTPGVDERLQTGQNPIEVSVNAIQNNQWNGQVPGWFSDAHDRSYVLGYVPMSPEPTVNDCPTPQGPPDQCPDGSNPGDLNGDGVADAQDCGYVPPTVVPIPAQETLDPCNPHGVSNNVSWKDPLPADSATVDWSESNNGATRTATLIGNAEWSDGTTAPKVFNLPADSGTSCPPNVVNVPAAPSYDDPCGPSNATWNEPGDDATFMWDVLPNGHLVVTIVAANTTFPGGDTTHDYGTAPDSNEACPPEEKVSICHATGSASHPYELIPNLSPAGVFNGHLDDDFGGTHGDHQNGEDIIPPFEYQGQTYSQNWDAEGQAIFNNGCKVPDEPNEPAEPTVKAVSDACVKPGESTGVVDVTVTNTDDETNDTVTYDVTLNGVTKQVTIADGASGSVQFTGLAAGSYAVSVTGDDGTSASTTVKVEECEVPPEPAEPTVQAAAQGCVNPGASNGTAQVVVTNTDDETNETVTYQVTLGGTTQSVTIADGSSATLQFSGLEPGTYSVSVVGDDDTSASTTVVVEECEVPPVYNPDGSVNAGCLGNARWVLDNRGSNQPVFFEITVTEDQTSSIRLVRVKAGDRKVIRSHGLKPGTVLTLGVLDVRLDREVVPGACDGNNPPPPNNPPPGTPNNPTTADTGMGMDAPTAASGQSFYYGLSAMALMGLAMVSLGLGLRRRTRRVEASV